MRRRGQPPLRVPNVNNDNKTMYDSCNNTKCAVTKTRYINSLLLLLLLFSQLLFKRLFFHCHYIGLGRLIPAQFLRSTPLA